jgi:nitrous oxidase accessory protein NosD
MKTSWLKKVFICGLIFMLFGTGVFPLTMGTLKIKTVIMGPNSPGYIQGLIDNASNGDTIVIPSGTYYENIIVNKSINLIGEDKNTTIIDGALSETVITITANEVTVTGFTVRNGKGTGIHIKSNRVTIHNNIIVNNSMVAINLYNVSSIITGISITCNTIRCSLLTGVQGFQIKDLRISNNSILYFLQPILIDFVQNATIQSNTIIGFDAPLPTLNKNQSRYILHSLLSYQNASGLIISESNEININANIIHGGDTLIFDNSSSVNITHNTIIYENTGLISLLSHLTFTENNILRKNTTYLKQIIIADSTVLFNANYWYRPRLLPKIIIGLRTIDPDSNTIFPKIFIDWHPALRPYDVPNIS